MDTHLVTPVKSKRYELIQKLKLFIVTKKCLCRKRKNVVSDFEETDLECPRDRIKYWHISQKTYKALKMQNRILRSQNIAMMREMKSFRQLTNQLKNENTIGDHCYSVLHRGIC